MAVPFSPDLSTINSLTLTPLVRRSLDRPDAELIDWKSVALQGSSFNSAIYRFSGNALDGGLVLPWSLILKIVTSPDGSDDPTSERYWKREALAFQSGLFDKLPPMICAPRCFGIVEPSGLETWLWMEELVDALPGRWSLDQYGNVARHLGRFNAACCGEPSLQTQPWLAKGRLRTWVRDAPPEVPPEVRHHPLVALCWPEDIDAWMQRVRAQQETWLAAMERQPQTLSHLDAFRRNIFARRDKQGEMQSVLIDWGFVGSAAPGEEIAPLVAASLSYMEVDFSQAKALDQVVFEGYLEGLRQSGWRGDPRVVRSTYAAASILRYCIGVSGVAFMIADEKQPGLLEQAFGHPLEELVEVWTKQMRFLFDLNADVSFG